MSNDAGNGGGCIVLYNQKPKSTSFEGKGFLTKSYLRFILLSSSVVRKIQERKKGMFRFFNAQLQKRPVITQIWSTGNTLPSINYSTVDRPPAAKKIIGLLFLMGDAVAQHTVQKKPIEQHDWPRTARMVSYGTLFAVKYTSESSEQLEYIMETHGYRHQQSSDGIKYSTDTSHCNQRQ